MINPILEIRTYLCLRVGTQIRVQPLRETLKLTIAGVGTKWEMTNTSTHYFQCKTHQEFSNLSFPPLTETERAGSGHVRVGRGAGRVGGPRRHERAGGALHSSAAGARRRERPAGSGGHEEPLVLLPGPRDGRWVSLAGWRSRQRVSQCKSTFLPLAGKQPCLINTHHPAS